MFDKLLDQEFNQVIQSYAFITLVETWLPTKSEINIEGFYSFSKSRKKNRRARRHSGGISSLVKQNLKRGVKIIDEKWEGFLWFKLCEDFFHLPQDIFVCSVYIPPANFPRQRKLDMDHFTPLNEQILKYRSQGDIILCGTVILGFISRFHPIFRLCNNCDVTYIDEILFLETM